MAKRILGLDPGTDSLGWAVVEQKVNGTYELIKKGVLRFDAGAKTSDGDDTPAALRRKFRGLRRRFYRRRLRKIELLKVLVSEGLCPYVSKEDLDNWRFHKVYPMLDEFLSWQKTQEQTATAVEINPYLYRYRCLTEKLDLSCQEDRYVLGRTLYHLVQRRGFRSNRKDDMLALSGGEGQEPDEKQLKKAKKKAEANAKADERSAIKGGIRQLEKDMEDAGCDWLGQYLYLLYKNALRPNTVRLRGRYVSRKMYEDEFQAICRMQCLSEDLVERLRRAIYFQRELKSQKYTMGHCKFEKSHTRCYTSHPDYEEFRLLQFINNIRVKKHGFDTGLRPLTDLERSVAVAGVMAVKTRTVRFKVVAEAIAGKKNFFYTDDDESDKGSKVFEFNFPMDTEVPDCPFIKAMKGIFGDDWQGGAAEVYTLAAGKTLSQVADDIWHVLYFFNDRQKVLEFAQNRLQMDDRLAEKFSNLVFRADVAALSLKAVRGILPFLRMGLPYHLAVIMAKVPSLLKQYYTPEIEREFINLFDEKGGKQAVWTEIAQRIADITGRQVTAVKEKLYFHSEDDVYPQVPLGGSGLQLLGSPETRSFRNPTAMKAMHQIRYVINGLLTEGIIDRTAHIHIEYPRALNGTVQRRGLELFQKWEKNRREEARQKIEEWVKDKGMGNFKPTEDQIQRVVLALEQNWTDIYMDGLNNHLGMGDIIGGECDIDHIVPRCKGGDNSLMNKVLVGAWANRQAKGNMQPYQLPNYENIKNNLAYKFYYERYKNYDRKARASRTDEFKVKAAKYCNRLIADYWRGKWERFTMTEEPEGFKMWQGPGNATIARYLGRYLGSFFYRVDNEDGVDKVKSNVFIVKGMVTAQLRHVWGLQQEWEEKDRDNHCHHCKDAVVIACAGRYELNRLSRKLREDGMAAKIQMPLPWPTFVEDMKRLEDDTVVYYRTKDNFGTQTIRKRKIKVKAADGSVTVREVTDCGFGIRDSLYMDTFYSCGQHTDASGKVETLMAKRETLAHFADKKNEKHLNDIVDDKIRTEIVSYVNGKGGELPWQNRNAGIGIGGTRIRSGVVPSAVKPTRDGSRKEWKRCFLSKNDGNYCLALYKEGKQNEFKLVSNIEAAENLKQGISMVPELSPEKNLPLVSILKKGKHVIFHDGDRMDVKCWSKEELVARLWYITKFDKKGLVGCRYHQCGAALDKFSSNGLVKKDKERTIAPEGYRFVDSRSVVVLNSGNLYDMLVEGQDFRITATGDIKLFF